MKGLDLEHWCLYRERSVYETLEYLKRKGWILKEAQKEVNRLKNNGFINEERFAKAFVSGKHKINKWGKHKILAGLQKHNLSQDIQKIALSTLDEEIYQSSLIHLIRNQKNRRSKNQLIKWLMGRGFEYQIIVTLLSNEKFDESD